MDGMTHDVEEKERRFASTLAGWLQTKAEKHEIDHLVVFAPPRLLSVLRKGPLGLSNGHIETLEGNLMHLDAGQLAEHPMVRVLVQAMNKP
jgi:protein required for attachment to host cells